MKIFIWSHNHVFCMKHLWPNPVFIITLLFVSFIFYLSQQDDQEPKAKLDEGWVCWVGSGGHSRGRRTWKSQGKKTKKGQSLATSFVPASQWCSLPSGGQQDNESIHPPPTTTTTTPSYILHNPSFCYRSHTCQARSASQSPAHGQMAWPFPAQMIHNSERGVGWLWGGSHLADMRKPALS